MGCYNLSSCDGVNMGEYKMVDFDSDGFAKIGMSRNGRC